MVVVIIVTTIIVDGSSSSLRWCNHGLRNALTLSHCAGGVAGKRRITATLQKGFYGLALFCARINKCFNLFDVATMRL